MAPQFSPIPETKTLFNPALAAHTYTSLGVKNVISLYKSIDLRVEGYAFVPFQSINDNNKVAEYSGKFKHANRHYLASAALVFKSPLGPVSFTTNYMDFRTDKWSFLFNFNYIVFNRKALGNF